MIVAKLADLKKRLSLQKVGGMVWLETITLGKDGKEELVKSTQVADDLERIGKADRDRLLANIHLVDANWPDFRKIPDTKVKPIEHCFVQGQQLYEFKRHQHRLVYFMQGTVLHFCHYCRKKQDKWSTGELTQAVHAADRLMNLLSTGKGKTRYEA